MGDILADSSSKLSSPVYKMQERSSRTNHPSHSFICRTQRKPLSLLAQPTADPHQHPNANAQWPPHLAPRPHARGTSWTTPRLQARCVAQNTAIGSCPLTLDDIQESPIRLGRRPPSKPAQETPLSTGPGHSGGATIPPPRIAVAHDPVMRLDIYPVQKQPGTSHQVVDSPQTPKRDRRSEGRMAIACATPQLSSNDAMASMRELYASPEQPPTPSDPTRETESVGNSDSDEDEEAEEEVQFNTPRRSFFKAPCATPTRAVNGGSWFSPARPGRNA